MSRPIVSTTPMPEAAEHSDVLVHLRHGDLVEAKSADGTFYHGSVCQVAPKLGVVWIDEAPLGLRKMLDSGDYVIRVVDDAAA